MISVTAHVNVRKLEEFVPFADAGLRDLVDDARQHGELFMSSIVPHGQSNRLAAAVVSSIYSIDSSHHIGSIGVDQRIAPYAGFVDKGTGVDGPERRPVSVTRMVASAGPRQDPYGKLTGSRPGVMRFIKNGEPPRFRRVVKAAHSTKIMRGKDFSGRTQHEVYNFTRIQTSVLAVKLAMFFADDHI